MSRHVDHGAWVSWQTTRGDGVFGKVRRQIGHKVLVERAAELKDAREHRFRNGLLAGSDDIEQRRNLLGVEVWLVVHRQFRQTSESSNAVQRARTTRCGTRALCSALRAL